MTNHNQGQETGSQDLPSLLDYNDLARITGESVNTHRRRKNRGTGPRALRIGRHIRFHPRDVSEWLERCGRERNSGGAMSHAPKYESCRLQRRVPACQ